MTYSKEDLERMRTYFGIHKDNFEPDYLIKSLTELPKKDEFQLSKTKIDLKYYGEESIYHYDFGQLFNKILNEGRLYSETDRLLFNTLKNFEDDVRRGAIKKYFTVNDILLKKEEKIDKHVKTAYWRENLFDYCHWSLTFEVIFFYEYIDN